MKAKFYFYFVLFVGLLLCSCQSSSRSSFNQDVEKEKIHEIIDKSRKFLLSKDVTIFRELIACEDSTISIFNGEILVDKFKNKTDEKLMEEFGLLEYNFTKIEELNKPIVRISSDGQMAYYVIREKFYYEKSDSIGNLINGEFIITYLSVLVKNGDCWSESACAQTMAY